MIIWIKLNTYPSTLIYTHIDRFRNLVKLNQYWITITLLFYLAPNEIWFGVKSIGKVLLQSKFGHILKHSEND